VRSESERSSGVRPESRRSPKSGRSSRAWPVVRAEAQSVTRQGHSQSSEDRHRVGGGQR
jgi:hypothetical protein